MYQDICSFPENTAAPGFFPRVSHSAAEVIQEHARGQQDCCYQLTLAFISESKDIASRLFSIPRRLKLTVHGDIDG